MKNAEESQAIARYNWSSEWPKHKNIKLKHQNTTILRMFHKEINPNQSFGHKDPLDGSNWRSNQKSPSVYNLNELLKVQSNDSLKCPLSKRDRVQTKENNN